VGLNGYGVCSNLASSGEPPASQNHFNHWLKVDRKTNQRTVTTVQTAEDQSDEKIWQRDKVTDAAQMTQHGEAVRDSAAHMSCVRITRSQKFPIHEPCRQVAHS